MMVWLFFADLFDPAKVVATERLDTQRRTGAEALRTARAAAAPPPC